MEFFLGCLLAALLALLCSSSIALWHLLRTLKPRPAVAFFHPFPALDGGGGERVLWCAVRALLDLDPHLACVIYTADGDATPDGLSARALRSFGVKLASPPKVVHLRRRFWVEAKTYPYFTVLGQSLGSMVLGLEALMKYTPLIFFDTSGYAFIYPLARAFGCKVVCYTHYPTISSGMLARVLGRTASYNNRNLVARSLFLSLFKAIYYIFMTVLYGFVGSYAHLAMVNSSWTQSHIRKLWKISDRIVRVYPPCDTRALQMLPLERKGDDKDVFFISVAQFRPEKGHGIQLEAFAKVVNCLYTDEYFIRNRMNSIRLKLVGCCRHKQDESRVEKLKLKCKDLGIEKHVDFLTNVSYRELVDLLGGAIAGLHSMTDEHFGIVVVEYMAAGVIPIAHNSAGPKMDIVVDQDGERIGFLAATVQEYAIAMTRVMKMPREKRLHMAQLARRRAMAFSVEHFDKSFKSAMSPILDQIRSNQKFCHNHR